MTQAARADLAEIWAFIAADSPAAAHRFIRRLTDRLEPLREFPGLGAPRDELAHGLRAVIYGNYAIYYRATNNEVIIVRVLHGARDARAIFGG
jgi:toxin ParE1/3/4